MQFINSGYEKQMMDESIKNAMNVQGSQYAQASGYQQPYLQAGQQSLAQLLGNLQSGAYNVNVTPQNLQNDPGYQFQMQQGLQALQRSAAAKGGLGGGAFAKAMTQYSQGLAANQYQNAWNRQFQQNQANYNNLMGVTGMGQNSAQSLGQLATNYGNAMSNLYAAQGNAAVAARQNQVNSAADIENSGTQLLASMAGGGGMGGGNQPAPSNNFPSIGGGGGNMGSIMNSGGYGYGPSASSLYASNPGNYSLGNYSLSQPSMNGYDPSSVGLGSPQAGGGYSLGNYNLVPPQAGGD